ncbi:MAG: UDP-N-acetylglucosamine 4,6-dehydratase (inverting) [Acholeplasma sp.]|nr:UDP-N-acetylglucosamine 4,6-dehydratase (inverting) [Acholeplasma sp.]
MLNGKNILVTGGTGSFGNSFIEYVLNNYEPNEFKQYQMAEKFKKHSSKLRFFIGDVRDYSRLKRALSDVDFVIHAAAMKQVPACEYNPIEAINTNINGAVNVINASLDCGVKKVIALSTDKAVSPVNLYGGTKLVSDKLFVAANAYSGAKGTKFSIVRYGNVAGSRGSVIPYFDNLLRSGQNKLPITDFRMTRFWISLREGVELVIKALEESNGGETFISKIPSFRITDLAYAMKSDIDLIEVGIREGEKLHEVMITSEDAPFTYEYNDHFIIYPNLNWWEKINVIPGGRKVNDSLEYSSGNNSVWLDVDDIRKRLTDLGVKII